MVPYPTTDGGRQRLHHLLSGILMEHQVFFAATSAENEPTADWPLANRFLAPPVIVPVEPAGDGSHTCLVVSGTAEAIHSPPLVRLRVLGSPSRTSSRLD